MIRAAPDASVRLSGLTRRFGSAVAVDALTLEVAPGELFGLVGPDGAGKTTTLRMLAGVLPPSEGDAHVCGVSIAEDPEGAKPHLAYMAQRFGLYEDLTVAENLDFYADLFEVPRAERAARLDRLYRFSRLDEFRDRRAGALSGGMKQKLGLSCALIHQPRLLLLDEPTFGVDPISRRELWVILEEMVRGGTTLVVSTSYMDEAERCDRVALLHEGRLLALDSPAALRAALPGTLFELHARDPRRCRERLRAHPGVLGASLFGDAVHLLLAAGADVSTAMAWLATAGIEVLEVHPVEPTLEDVFIHRVSAGTSTSPPSGVM
ncbi:ABC transporter ATP-binding protein [Gaopeijia maritima]|uniref:ABC transporter ATP-binding protein n=1 Tax=Gaopeijia maritima TaxID=3119007 RepID=A0ABU9E615_9BACT